VLKKLPPVCNGLTTKGVVPPVYDTTSDHQALWVADAAGLQSRNAAFAANGSASLGDPTNALDFSRR
jgi:hypothetical protein